MNSYFDANVQGYMQTQLIRGFILVPLFRYCVVFTLWHRSWVVANSMQCERVMAQFSAGGNIEEQTGVLGSIGTTKSRFFPGFHCFRTCFFVP